MKNGLVFYFFFPCVSRIIYHVIFIFSFQRYRDGFRHISSTYIYIYIHVYIILSSYICVRCTARWQIPGNADDRGKNMINIPFRIGIYNMCRKRERIMNIINFVLSDIYLHTTHFIVHIMMYKHSWTAIKTWSERFYFDII